MAVEYTEISGSSDTLVARFNIDGSPDTRFGTGGFITHQIGLQEDSGERVTLQADGNIMVTGYAEDGLGRIVAVSRYAAT